jgi:GT2 family glycosyltransferase
MNVSTITVNYYSETDLPALEKSLDNQDHLSQRIIVNNGSSSKLTDIVSDFTIIENPYNQGFASAVNHAISECTNRWVLLVNPDVVLHDNCIDELLNNAIKHSSPIVGPRFYLDDACHFKLPPTLGDCAWQRYAQIAASHSILDRQLLDFAWIIRHERFWDATEPFFEPFLSGSCLLVDKDTLCSNGKLFDEKYFLYYEDTDLCVHALKLGHRPLCIPSATAIHYFDQSPDPEISKYDLMQQAQENFFAKHYKPIPESIYSLSAVNEGWKAIEEVDLGTISSPPSFTSHSSNSRDMCFIELSLSFNFIPFVQAAFIDSSFTIPDDIWNRLRPGTYFARQRCRDLGMLAIWRWKKA